MNFFGPQRLANWGGSNWGRSTNWGGNWGAWGNSFGVGFPFSWGAWGWGGNNWGRSTNWGGNWGGRRW